MGCREAQAILSALADAEPVSDAQLAELKEHGKSCADCAGFQTALVRLETARPPSAPAELAPRILAAIAAESDAQAELATAAAIQAQAALETAESPQPETRQDAPAETGGLAWARLTPTRLWATAATLASAAAVIALTVMLSGQSADNVATEKATADLASRGLSGGPSGSSGAPQTSGLPGAAASVAPAKAPPFIASGGKVFAPSASKAPPASQLTTIGVVRTALDSGGPPADLGSYASSADPTVLVLRLTDGDYRSFAPVVRTFNAQTYQLVTGVDLPRYGVWPRLPGDVPEPAAADGSPDFILSGADAVGVKIYARVGSGTQAGFAVPPGTGPNDPSGGNPNWTWWARVP